MTDTGKWLGKDGSSNSVHGDILILKSGVVTLLMGCNVADCQVRWKDSLWMNNTSWDIESSSSQDEEHNVDNRLLYSFAHYDHSPLIQSFLLDWEVCKSALTCRFALDVISLCQI